MQLIVFDLGNVLLDFDHRIAAKRISQFTRKTPQEIFNLFFNSSLTQLFEEGKISPYDFFLKIKQLLSAQIGYEDFIDIWNKIFFLTEKNHAVYNIASILSKKYKVVLLSNINTLHLEYIKNEFAIFDIFCKVFASCEVGLCKPDPEIYYRVLREMNASAERVFYTDDRSELVENAKALGIKGFVFTGVEQLKRDIISSGIEL